MNKKPKIDLRNPEYIIALGVTIISLCALVVSVMQTQIMKEERELMREYSRASVWPRLEFGVMKGHNQDRSIRHFVLTLTNSGVGPAIITDVKVMYDKEVSTDWWDLFLIQEIPDSVEKYISNANFNDRVIKIGESLEILNLNENLELAQAFLERLDKLSIVIYYESIYGEKWKYEIGEEEEKTIKVENFSGLPKDEQFGN
ncbi:MAG: hypothetical protein AAGA66_19995 [Bacteroidota bacterium]